LAQEPGPEHELRGLLDQRSLAEDPPVIWLASLVPEHFVAHVGGRRAAGEDVIGILSARGLGRPEGAKIAREGSYLCNSTAKVEVQFCWRGKPKVFPVGVCLS
jgi:hypothetical protein